MNDETGAKMKLKFDIDTHHTADGRWVAQIVFDGTVIHEDEGVASESQAISNVRSSFAYLLRTAVVMADERLTEEANT